MTLSVLNDPHIGAIRSGGTTPGSQLELRTYVNRRVMELLALCDDDVLINGDLFDAFMVPFTDLWSAVESASAWLRANDTRYMYAARGNHDIAKNTMQMSSFDLFCRIMASMFPQRFVAITEPMSLVRHKAYVIPHMPNQDLFDKALAEVQPCKYLFVHANFDNKFAVEADHSLNVSPEQAEKAPVERIIFGHEHQRREALGGKVVIVGNQIPTSVADCLGNDVKYLLKVGDSFIEHSPVWEAAKEFARPDWRELDTVDPAARFVRVQGDATSAEAATVVQKISKLRSRSDAFVITNAVSIDGQAVSEEEIKLSLESVKQFDVLTELLSLLDDEEAATLKNLMEKNNVVSASQAE